MVLYSKKKEKKKKKKERSKRKISHIGSKNIAPAKKKGYVPSQFNSDFFTSAAMELSEVQKKIRAGGGSGGEHFLSLGPPLNNSTTLHPQFFS